MDEQQLVEDAIKARKLAYTPYSHYSVGAALITEEGVIVQGANIENASYGLTTCAERSAVFAAVLKGCRVIQAIAIATNDGGSPCGACRQVLMEFAPDDPADMAILLVDEQGVIRSRTNLAALFPLPFRLKQ